MPETVAMGHEYGKHVPLIWSRFLPNITYIEFGWVKVSTVGDILIYHTDKYVTYRRILSAKKAGEIFDDFVESAYEDYDN